MVEHVNAAGLILCHQNGAEPRWLLLENSKRSDWGFPKGHTEPGESLLHSALRECAEETGIALVSVEGDPLQISYQVRADKQKTVYYYPAQTAITDVRISKEHARYEWLGKKDVLNRLPHKNIIDVFKQYLKQEGF